MITLLLLQTGKVVEEEEMLFQNCKQFVNEVSEEMCMLCPFPELMESSKFVVRELIKEKERLPKVPDTLTELMEEPSSSRLCATDKPYRIMKKVRFDDTNLVQVVEFEDDEESRLNRKLYWEFFAVDRARFKDRISRSEDVLSPILGKDHREKVYNRKPSEFPASEPTEKRMTNLSDLLTKKAS